MQQISFEFESKDGIRFIKPNIEELGFRNRQELEHHLLDETISESIRALDLSSVQTIDSSTLGVLLKANEKLNLQNKVLAVCGLNIHVQGVMKLTRMHYILNLFNSREEVIQKYADK